MKRVSQIRMASAVAAALFLLPLFASAATFGGGTEYSVSGEEVIQNDVYAGAGTVVISGGVAGDVLSAGGTVLLDGSIEEDVFAAGGSVSLSGGVGSDARLFGGTVLVNNRAGEDLVIVGGSVIVLSGAAAGGDAAIVGGRVQFSGTVGRQLFITGGDVFINGEIADDVVVRAERVELGESAVIRGNFTYHAPEEAVIHDDARIDGDVVYRRTKGGYGFEQGIFGGLVGLFLFWKIVTLLAAGILAVLLYKRLSYSVSEIALGSFGSSFVRGFVVLVVVPVAAVLLFISAIGFLVGVFGVFAYALLLLAARVYAGIAFGGLLWSYLSRAEARDVTWKTTVLGVVVFELLALVPVVGWIIRFVFVLAALGALSLLLYRGAWKER